MLGVKQDTKHADLPEILTLIRKKNQAGFELLYARYYRFLFSTAYMVLRQESDAMDAVQNAALRLYTMDESLFPSDHELAWLHTVVKNEALMVQRKKKPEHSVDELPEIPVFEGQMDALEDMESVQSMLSSLDQKRQNVVTLKVLGGLSHKEIAQLLSVPVGTVQWLYNTSIKSLRRTLAALASVAIVSASEPAAYPRRSGQRGNRFCQRSSVPGGPVFPRARRRFWDQQHPTRRAVPVSLVYGVVDPADRLHCSRNSFFQIFRQNPNKAKSSLHLNR